MSNVETKPPEIVCRGNDPALASAGGVLVLRPRDVPLGGPRAMTVRRTLPHRDRSFVGAWCFVDHYGPDDVATSGGMDVPPHPHTGLQTLSWLFEGEIEHHDSGGVHAMVRPGAMNLMTGGHGIAHSEVSTAATTTLHGVQLWVCLPAATRDAPRDFQHFEPTEVVDGPARVRVFVGSLVGQSSPVETHTPLLGAEVTIAPGGVWRPAVDPAYEHAVLVDTGAVDLNGHLLARGDLGIRDNGPDRLSLTNSGDVPARVLLLGGTPFEEEIVMWWNFIGRSHDEVVALREEWQAESERFGSVEGYAGRLARLPAPTLPGGTLRPRGRGGRR